MAYLNGYICGIFDSDKAIIYRKDVAAIKKQRMKISNKKLKDLIEKKLGVLKPTKFREDIIIFIQLLENFEGALEDTITIHKYGELAPLRLQDISKATTYYTCIIEYFLEFLEFSVRAR